MAADHESEHAPDVSSSRAEAIVDDVGFDVAHDSDGLLIVTLRYANGARAQLQLEGARIGRLLEALELDTVQGLLGRPFSDLAPALPSNSGERGEQAEVVDQGTLYPRARS